LNQFTISVCKQAAHILKNLAQQSLFIFILLFVSVVHAQTFPTKPIADTYSKALFTILAIPEIKERLTKLGIEAVPRSMEHTKKFLDAEKQKYTKLIQYKNIKGE
jgi:hypothetical protein